VSAWADLATTRVLVGMDLDVLKDTFTRDVTDGVGAADTGQAYTVVGTASEYDVASTLATMALVATNDLHHAYVDVGYSDVVAQVQANIPLRPTGAPINARVAARWSDTLNHYEVSVDTATTGVVTLSILRRVANVGAVLASTTLAASYPAGGTWWIRFSCVGSTLSASAWRYSDPPPSGWLVSCTDTALSTGTMVALGARRDTGNLDGTVSIIFDDFKVTVSTEVDLCSPVNYVQSVSCGRGRQSELSGMDPSTLSLTLVNQDGRFTPANPTSPYFPYWTGGIPIRWEETIGARTFVYFNGFIELPESAFTYLSADGATDNTLSLSAVDTLTRLGRSSRYISVVAAHVMNSPPASDLVAYWPMGDQAFPAHPVVGPDTIAALPAIHSTGGVITSYADALLTPAAGPPIGVDELTPPRWLCDVDAAGTVWAYQPMGLTLPTTLTVTSTITLVAWVYIDITDGVNSAYPFFLSGTSPPGSAASQGFIYLQQLSPGSWSVQFFAGASGLLLSVPDPKTNGWSMIAAQMSVPSGACTVWVDGTTTTGTLSGSPPATVYFDVLTLGQFFAGSVGHVQLYVGTAFDQAAFTAQRELALYGAERELTGARITRVLEWAGLTHPMLDRIDPGTSVMAPLNLAGKTPLEAITEAATTEQGRLFTAGDGSIVFHDRHRVLDV
jgi:hypothetical protein